MSPLTWLAHTPGAGTPRCATGAKGYYLEDKITMADLWLSYFKVEQAGSIHRLYIILKLCRIVSQVLSLIPVQVCVQCTVHTVSTGAGVEVTLNSILTASDI